MVNKCFGGWTFRHRWMDGRKESPEADVAHEKGDLRNNKNMFSVRIIWREEIKLEFTTKHVTSTWYKVGEHGANLKSFF